MAVDVVENELWCLGTHKRALVERLGSDGPDADLFIMDDRHAEASRCRRRTEWRAGLERDAHPGPARAPGLDVPTGPSCELGRSQVQGVGNHAVDRTDLFARTATSARTVRSLRKCRSDRMGTSRPSACRSLPLTFVEREMNSRSRGGFRAHLEEVRCSLAILRTFFNNR